MNLGIYGTCSAGPDAMCAHETDVAPGLQEFILIRVLDDASGGIRSTSWSGQFLAAAGADEKIRLYGSSEESAVGLTSGVAGSVRPLSNDDSWIARFSLLIRQTS